MSKLTFGVKTAGLVTISVLGASVCAWTLNRSANSKQTPKEDAPTGTSYSREGFGGYVPQTAPRPPIMGESGGGKLNLPRPPIMEEKGGGSAVLAGDRPGSGTTRATDMLAAAYRAYAAGRYVEAVKAAESVTVDVRSVAKAHLLAGYCEARLGNMQLAREWFARTRDEASKLPDHGERSVKLGPPMPAIEEEAAFEHAVCTASLGEPAEAETEYLQIMRDYPESSLVHGAIKRIALLHHRDIPPEAEKVWNEAMAEAKRRQQARKRDESLCGPECIAELIRRKAPRPPNLGERAPKSPTTGENDRAVVRRLAEEMGTTHEGTTLAAMVESANRHGMDAEGLALTERGLEKQRLPVVALVNPGHFVIVESVKAGSITVWDPDGRSVGKGSRTDVSRGEWTKRWSGVALAIR